MLRKNGNVLSLTTAELKILAKLMRSPKRVFTKTQLCECINGRYYENDDRTMMVHISNIRAKIEDDRPTRSISKPSADSDTKSTVMINHRRIALIFKKTVDK